MEKENDDFPGIEHERPPTTMYVSGFLAQCCVIAACVMIGLWMGSYTAEPGLSWVNLMHRLHLHPFLMALAVVFCSTEAILVYRMLRSISKPIVKGIHVFLHTATLALVGTALAAMIEFKNGSKFPHLYSAHSWFGLIVIFLYIGQYVLGIVFFLLPVASENTRQAVLPFHKFFGLCAYFFALVTVCMGMFDFLESIVGTSVYPNLGIQARLGNASCIVLLILGGTVMHIMTRSAYARPNASENLFEPEPL